MKINTLNLGLRYLRPPEKLLLIMKLTTFILIIALAQVCAKGFGQKITLNATNTPIEKILQSIRQQSGFEFIYDANDLKGQRVTLKLDNASVDDAIKASLKDLALDYKILEKNIVITKKAPSLLDKLASVIQNNLVIQNGVKDLVKGRVVDQDGKPLPNASIRIKGKNTVINTNQNGEFEIKNVADDAVLLISYVGFRTLELPLKDVVMPLEIKLNVATGELEEVKVVYNTGYQELNKERATGSFVHIDNELLNRKVSTNILDRIYEITSGLNFEENPSAAIRTKPNITIRGISTINAEKNPLIVLDNFPFAGDISTINPNDVESVTVLKDAAAASIWGVRAGNGVIVITTKQGKYNLKTKVAFNSNVSLIEKPRLMEQALIASTDIIDIQQKLFGDSLYNAFDDIDALNKNFPALPEVAELLLAVRKGKITKAAADAKIALLRNHDVRSDIDKYLNQNSINQQYNMNVSGGSLNYNYYASVGYDKNRAAQVGSNIDRFTLRYNNTFKLSKKLSLNSILTYAQHKVINNGIGLSNVSQYTMLADETGKALAIPRTLRLAYVDTVSYPKLLDWHYRPLDELNAYDSSNKLSDIIMGIGVRYDILPGLSTDLKYQYQKSIGNNKRNSSLSSYAARDLINQFMGGTRSMPVYPVPLGDIVDQTNSESLSSNVRGQLNFSRCWAQHTFNALAGMEISNRDTEASSSIMYGYDPEISKISSVNNITLYPVRPSGLSTIPSDPSPSKGTDRLINYFANGSYTFKDRYIVSASGRIDYSNFFGVKANNRKVPLWSMGVAWDISKENFYKVSWLPSLKIRGTYGYNGNLTRSTAAYTTILYTIMNQNNSQTAQIVSVLNPQLRWEKSRMFNLGIDFGIMNNRVNGSVEYYHKKGIDLVSQILTDPTVGVASYTGNNATTKGEGLDVILGISVIEKSSFKWNSNILFNYNTDKVVSYMVAPKTAAEYYQSDGVPVIGRPLYKLYGYRWGGLDPKTGDPRAYLADTIANFNTVHANAKPSDMEYGGQTLPKFFGSFRNTISINEFSISFNIVYKMGHFFRRNSVNYSSLLSVSNIGTGHADYYRRWKGTGDELKTNVPSMPVSGTTAARQVIYSNSTALIEKADFFRLQDVRLGYDLNKRILKKMSVQSVTIFMYAGNVGLLWTANKQKLDPESPNIPKPKSLSFGLSINF